MVKFIFTSLLMLTLTLSCFGADINYKGMTPHPRLLLTAGSEEKIKNAMVVQPKLRNVHERILREGREVISLPPVKRIKTGRRLLSVSREALKRIFYLAYGYRMTGEYAMAERAEQEILAVCDFTDWNPTHFLDVGEMTMAVALGYDWLFDVLKPETKAKARIAILEKGFAPANSKYGTFYKKTNNWNSVCNAGLTYGALAIYEDVPAECENIIERCLETNPKALKAYGPDGGYPEGFMYWGYGTAFQVMLDAALQTALGSDFGLSLAPGFLQSAKFMLHMVAPSNSCFSFSDCHVVPEANMMLYWFADKLNEPSVIYLEQKYLADKSTEYAEPRLLPTLMIFASNLDLKNVKAPADNFWYNRGATPVFTYRSGWDSPTDAYLGVKGGSPYTSHAHMDAGSFVYELNGVRWATDLGMQNYESLEGAGLKLWDKSPEGQRWDVFRIGSTAHNTLTVNGVNHVVKAKAEIVDTLCSPWAKGAVVDMSPVMGNELAKSTRRVILDAENNLRVTDSIMAPQDKNASVMWVMVTAADARITGRNKIELVKDGLCMILTATAANLPVTMKIWDNKPKQDYDEDNPGTCRVGFTVDLPAGQETVLDVTLEAS